MCGVNVLRAVPATVLLAATALLGGCGDDPDEVTPKSETLPVCDDVWVAGNTLPEDYEGCKDADGVLVVSDVKQCTETDGSFTTFAARYYAMLGGEIHDDGQSSSGYATLYVACLGAQ